MNSTVLMTYEARWRCRSTAALGSPVVPLVNSRMAMSSGSAIGGVAAGSTPSSSARNWRRGTSSTPSSAPTRAGTASSTTTTDGAVRARIGAQLVVGEPVVDRDERHPRVAGAEQQRRHDVGADVDEPDLLDTAARRPTSRRGGRGRAARRTSARRGRGDRTRTGRRRPRRPSRAAWRGARVPPGSSFAAPSVRRGQRFGVLLQQRVDADRQRAVARLGAQHLEPDRLVGVALADQRAGAVGVIELGARGRPRP